MKTQDNKTQDARAETEALVSCPSCGTTGFTPRGLTAHKCKGVNRNPAADGAQEALLPGCQATAAAEVVTASWERARRLLAGVKQQFRLAIATQALLGMELAELKKSLGFLPHGKNKGGPSGQFARTEKSWDSWITEELGISRRTGERFIEMGFAAIKKLKRLGGSQKLLGLLEMPVASYTAIDRQTLEEAIGKITDGLSQAELLEELKLVKCHDTSGLGKDTSMHRGDPPTVEQLAFGFFAPAAKRMHKLIHMPDLDAYLVAMHIDSDDEDELTLTTMERQYSTMLERVKAAKKAKMASLRSGGKS